MIAENVQYVREKIATACARCGRNPSEVTLVAVSKTFSASAIRQCVEAGATDVGENYVQELVRKREELAPPMPRWHFIGHLQRNKVKEIVSWIHLIQSVDSLHLGKELSLSASRIDRDISLLVEVNTSREQSKFGVSPDAAAGLVEELAQMPRLRVLGLMTIGPLLPDPEDARPAFKHLARIRRELQGNGIDLPHLSMGMTGDFETAIEEGSTMVRIGTAIFGKRTAA